MVTASPDEWDSAAAFHTRLQEVVPETPTTSQFAESCANIWGEFFTDQADVLVSLKRTLSSTKRNVECISNIWTVTSTLDESNLDESGWLQVGEHYDVTLESSKDLLISDLQNKVNELNGQPGAREHLVCTACYS